jgi:hypothetical protein
MIPNAIKKNDKEVKADKAIFRNNKPELSCSKLVKYILEK